MSAKFYTITNRMQRAFIVPDGPSNASVAINPGAAEPVSAEHWDAIRKGNAVIDALLLDRHLVVESGERQSDNAVPAQELSNPGSPLAPTELSDDPAGVKVEKKSEKAAVVDLQDEPKAGTGTVATKGRTAAPKQTAAPSKKR